MKSKKILLVIVLVFVLLLIGASSLYNQLGEDFAPEQLATQPPASISQTEGQTPAPNPVPDFTAYDLQGNAVKLSDFFGKPIVLNFWASWCGPCKSEMPHFEEKYLALKDDITFLMVNMTDNSRETVEIASAFVMDSGYTFPVLYDTEYHAASTYGVTSLPTTYFIDAAGNGVAQAVGAIDAETLQRGIDMIK